jgi:hypothetical protein
MPTQTLKTWEKNHAELPQTPRQRRAFALDHPFPVREGREPSQCLKRMVGPANKDTGRQKIKFISQLTVDMDKPVVWRFRAEFDERDLDIPVTSWSDELQEIAVDELYSLFPEWRRREKTWRKTGSTYIEWRTPLTKDELLLLGVPEIVAAPRMA